MCLFSSSVYVCLRALEMLQEINQSVNRRSRFSKLAMISLLNSNLSVKYSLTGHLASTDIISDGFYDAGKVCVSVCVLLKFMWNRHHLKEHKINVTKKLLSVLQTCS